MIFPFFFVRKEHKELVVLFYDKRYISIKDVQIFVYCELIQRV